MASFDYSKLVLYCSILYPVVSFWMFHMPLYYGELCVCAILESIFILSSLFIIVTDLMTRRRTELPSSGFLLLRTGRAEPVNKWDNAYEQIVYGSGECMASE